MWYFVVQDEPSGKEMMNCISKALNAKYFLMHNVFYLHLSSLGRKWMMDVLKISDFEVYFPQEKSLSFLGRYFESAPFSEVCSNLFFV